MMTVIKSAIILLITICFLSVSTGDMVAKSKVKAKKIKDLPYKYQTWLKKDVIHIISKTEKRIFLRLETNREREMFITGFWKNRDPNTNTPENEFKIEHYERMEYAKKRFGKGTPTPYWLTPRGRIHIILGEPHSLERYQSESQLYPTVVWFYQGLVKYGLPNAFYVVFFKEDNSGDYELYSPVRHGPHKLMVNYTGDTHDIMAAYRQLVQIAPNVAKVSMSLIEGDYLPGARPTVRSEILLSKQIVEAPTKRVNDDYAKKLEKYKNFIDVQYSVNYLANSSKVKIIKDSKTGFQFVHYMIEPQKLSLEQHDDTLYGNLEINGNITNIKGESVYQFNKAAPIKLKPNQMQKVQGKLFSYQDFFPLIPGTYRMEILIRNTTSREFTSLERSLVVPGQNTVGIGETMVANMVRKSPNSSVDKPFLLNGNQIIASPRNDFISGDKLHFFFQAHGLTDQQKQQGQFVFTVFKDDGKEKPLITLKKNINEYRQVDGISYIQDFSLAKLSASYYIVRVAVQDGAGKLLFQGEDNFYISPVTQLKRAWVVSNTTPMDGAEHLNTLAIQYSNIKNLTKAAVLLERAYNRTPTSTKLALNFCQVLFKLKRHKKLIQVAKPFLQTNQKQEFFSFLGFSSASLGQYNEAIKYFKEYLTYYGTNIKILNAIGQCYANLGNADEARVAWKKSLELLPDQTKVKSLIKGLKNLNVKEEKKEDKKNE